MSISPFALKLLRSCGDVSCQGAVPRRKQKSQGAPRTAAAKERGKPRQRMQTKSRRLRAEGKACSMKNYETTDLRRRDARCSARCLANPNTNLKARESRVGEVIVRRETSDLLPTPLDGHAAARDVQRLGIFLLRPHRRRPSKEKPSD
eukprot:CAMPEP_0170168832 /NCGR_PEP_ID=MMETSP0040_2-20121228/1776_1 /TAXON_ID=641309 /ORGANISM="Lotharella oceanica, Strain CCMP622" /LENGTH=147 /DNA_ID=CAMNT_0010407227 /DNA_START=147 /DNA_END=590 /DNA_ORIENTATION=+